MAGRVAAGTAVVDDTPLQRERLEVDAKVEGTDDDNAAETRMEERTKARRPLGPGT